MPTAHNQAQKGDIAKTVIMPGDPLRAKYIAENFMKHCRLVNEVRGVYAYTGTYQGKEITVMASGMGMPSMGIYSYELYHFYEVENIIRIGSCGAYDPNLKLFDLILSKSCYSESNFALTFSNENCHIADSSSFLNDTILQTAQEKNVSLIQGNTVCLDCFDVYMEEENLNAFLTRIPTNFHPIAAEMEAFVLFYLARTLKKNATCLMSVVDSKYTNQEVSAQERQTGLNTMIQLALDSATKL